VNVGATKI